MKNKDWIMVGGAAAVLGFTVWSLNKSTPLSHVFPQPEKATPTDPNILKDQTTMAVRYPARSGHEITVLIQHGLQPLWRPRPNLYTWMECPPSEVDN